MNNNYKNNLEALLSDISKFDLSTFPKSIILSGIFGSGKHTTYNYIVDKLHIPSINLTDVINNSSSEELNDYINNEINTKVEPYLYLIDFCNFNGKIELKENNLLKLLEEPLKNTYIIILCEKSSNLLTTIVNRCQVWNMPIYTQEYISKFTIQNNVECIADTPGFAMLLNDIDLKDYMEFCQKIFEKINVANYGNVLTIINKISFEGGEVGYQLNIFLKVLIFTIKNMLVKSYNDIYYKAYILTDLLINDMDILNINKKMLLENYLINLKGIMKCN